MARFFTNLFCGKIPKIEANERQFPCPAWLGRSIHMKAGHKRTLARSCCSIAGLNGINTLKNVAKMNGIVINVTGNVIKTSGDVVKMTGSIIDGHGIIVKASGNII